MRRLLVVPVGLLVIALVGFILGFAAQLPFFTFISILCALPLFLLSLGFAFGKASNAYRFFVPKELPLQQQQPQQRRQRLQTYSVGESSGDLRGN